MPANRTETGQFVKGCSGNPSGRPKQSDEERDALEEIKQLTPHAVDVLRELMTSRKTPAATRLKACEIVLNRVYGTPRVCANIAAKFDPSALREIDYSALDEIHYQLSRNGTA